MGLANYLPLSGSGSWGRGGGERKYSRKLAHHRLPNSLITLYDRSHELLDVGLPTPWTKLVLIGKCYMIVCYLHLLRSYV